MQPLCVCVCVCVCVCRVCVSFVCDWEVWVRGAFGYLQGLSGLSQRGESESGYQAGADGMCPTARIMKGWGCRRGELGGVC